MHNLVHLAEQVVRNGRCSDAFSYSVFENNIQVLKHLIRPTNRPLAQLAKRIMKRRLNPRRSVPRNVSPLQLFREHSNGPILLRLQGTQYRTLLLNSLKISIALPDNCVVLNCGEIVIIENIFRTSDADGGNVMILGKQLAPAGREFYQYPIEASKLGIVVVPNIAGPLTYFRIELIAHTAMKNPIPNSTNEFAILNLLLLI